jgi:hypothetical protein
MNLFSSIMPHNDCATVYDDCAMWEGNCAVWEGDCAGWEKTLKKIPTKILFAG